MTPRDRPGSLLLLHILQAVVSISRKVFTGDPGGGWAAGTVGGRDGGGGGDSVKPPFPHHGPACP